MRSSCRDRGEVKRAFIGDYLHLIDSFAELESQPKVFVCLPTLPSKVAANHDEAIGIRRETGGLDASIEAVAKLRNVTLIDLEWVVDDAALSVDGAHPDESGARSIAVAIHAALMADAVKSPSPMAPR